MRCLTPNNRCRLYPSLTLSYAVVGGVCRLNTICVIQTNLVLRRSVQTFNILPSMPCAFDRVPCAESREFEPLIFWFSGIQTWKVEEFFKNRVSPLWANGSLQTASKEFLKVSLIYHCLQNMNSDWLKLKICPPGEILKKTRVAHLKGCFGHGNRESERASFQKFKYPKRGGGGGGGVNF